MSKKWNTFPLISNPYLLLCFRCCLVTAVRVCIQYAWRTNMLANPSWRSAVTIVTYCFRCCLVTVVRVCIQCAWRTSTLASRSWRSAGIQSSCMLSWGPYSWWEASASFWLYTGQRSSQVTWLESYWPILPWWVWSRSGLMLPRSLSGKS